MPLVRIYGSAYDFSQVVIPAEQKPRLGFRPNKSRIGGQSSMLAGVESWAKWMNLASGAFEVELWSEPNDPDLFYTPFMDWLPPGQETEPPEQRARDYTEWPVRLYPGEGGAVGDLIQQVIGVGLVYSARDAPRVDRVNQLHWNTGTDWVYEREVTW